MKKKNKEFTIARSFILAYTVPGAILLAILASGMTLFTLSSTLDSRPLLIAGIIVVLNLTVFYIVVSVLLFRWLMKVYQNGLYKTTASLLRGLKQNIPTPDNYPKSLIKEMNELRSELDDVNVITANSTLISNDLSSAYIPLNYINEEDGVVTLQSFKTELRALIYSSQNYRNAIAEIFYDLEDDEITEEESKRIISVLRDSFVNYSHVLFIPNEDKSGFYMFIPKVDSLSNIRDRLEASLRSISVAKKTFDGIATINARFSVVCYPYSNINELFPDLKYAKRQGLPLNIYLPSRLTAMSENRILQNSINLNHMSRVMEKLTDLKVTSKEKNKSLKTIENTMLDLITYLDIDCAGIITFDDVNNVYESMLSLERDTTPIFPKGAQIEKRFIKALDEARDPDDSYYFSTRKHTPYEMGNFLDKIGVTSGFYYLIHDQKQVISVIYFFNKKDDMIMDSYIRETIFLVSYRIGDFFFMLNEENKIDETYREINSLLMSSDYSLYRIDKNNYDLMSFSSHFSTICPKAKIGDKCYHAIYGLDSPCENCPLRVNKKMISEIHHKTYETSLTLNETNTRMVRMLVHNIKSDDEPSDRFDKDLLINSYTSLNISLEDLYAINARGYLLVLRIDNHDQLLADNGSEGVLYIERQLIKNIKDIRHANANIYYFSPESIAILLPEVGQVDIVNFIEKIYEVSKQKYQFNGIDNHFNITYLPYNFPQSYPTADGFLKYVLRHFNSLQFETNVDKIFFPDGDYSRSASRNEFILSVIEEQFGNKTFSVALQPMVHAEDKDIYGAEILIRLSDNYRNQVFNADELIKVAARNGKISMISNALIQYIGELYKQYGLTVFKLYGFKRLTMNTDFSYFDDPEFFQTIFNLFDEYHLPKEFLGFEITEREIYNHLDQFRKVAKGILNHHIVLICDQYSGEYLSMDTLKELGFIEIKIGRYLVGDIEVNPKHLAEITSIDKLANEHGLKVTFVGVENSDQYLLIRDMDKKCNCQGYHFYKPLDDYHLIEEVRKNH